MTNPRIICGLGVCVLDAGVTFTPSSIIRCLRGHFRGKRDLPLRIIWCLEGCLRIKGTHSRFFLFSGALYMQKSPTSALCVIGGDLFEDKLITPHFFKLGRGAFRGKSDLPACLRSFWFSRNLKEEKGTQPALYDVGSGRFISRDCYLRFCFIKCFFRKKNCKLRECKKKHKK